MNLKLNDKMMKKRVRNNFKQCRSLVVVALFASCLAACDDDDQWVPGDIPGKGQTAVYSNKMSAPIGGNDLALTYSGAELIGKDVALAVDNAGKATLTLKGILPGEVETPLTGITLTPIDGGYAFTGNGVGKLETTFSFDGEVRKSKLTLNLREIRITDNPLIQNGVWNVVKTGGEKGELTQSDSIIVGPNGSYLYYDTQYVTGYGKGLMVDLGVFKLDVGSIVGLMLGNMVNSVLHDVTFHADGQITATYADFPVSDDLLSYLMDMGVPRNTDDWKISPSVNLASCYMTDDTTLYVTPNIDMIIRQIESGRLATRADKTSLFTAIEDIYKMLNAWTTTGIKLIVKERQDGSYVKEGDTYTQDEGDLSVAITAKELKPLIDLLNNLPASVLSMELDLLGSKTTLGELLKMIEITPDFSVWLYFNKAQVQSGK